MSPTLNAAIDRLHARLDEDPADAEARLVLADAYEEAGDPAAAECLRWMGRTGRHPERFETMADASGPSARWNFWCHGPRHGASNYPEHAHIPPLLWHYSCCNCPARRRAEEALMEEWRRLSSEDRLRLQAEWDAAGGPGRVG